MWAAIGTYDEQSFVWGLGEDIGEAHHQASLFMMNPDFVRKFESNISDIKIEFFPLNPEQLDLIRSGEVDWNMLKYVTEDSD